MRYPAWSCHQEICGLRLYWDAHGQHQHAGGLWQRGDGSMNSCCFASRAVKCLNRCICPGSSNHCDLWPLWPFSSDPELPLIKCLLFFVSFCRENVVSENPRGTTFSEILKAASLAQLVFSHNWQYIQAYVAWAATTWYFWLDIGISKHLWTLWVFSKLTTLY